VALILGGDFQRAHNASLTWRGGLCYYKPCPKATAITTSSSGQQSCSEFTCDGLAIQASDVAPEAKPPSKPIATEEEARRVRETITAQGYTVVLKEAEHGAHGTLMTMDDIIVKRGTKITVYLQSSVVPKLSTRSAAIITPIEEYDTIKQFEQQAPGVSIGHCTAPFTHSKPVPVTLLNMSNDDLTVKKGTTLATIIEADYELESSNEETQKCDIPS
jgi:hypothetical protein